MPLEVSLGLTDHNMDGSKGVLKPFHIKGVAQENVNFDGKDANISGTKFVRLFNFSSDFRGS